MKQSRCIGGAYREIVKEDRCISGVYREVIKAHRCVYGVYRQYFGGCPVSRAVIRLYQTTGSASAIKLKTGGIGYYHGSGTYTAKFILDLYDRNGNLINYNLLSDISGLDEFVLMVDTHFQIFSGSGTAGDTVFGVNASTYETFSSYAAYADGWFTVTKDNFTTKYIEINWNASAQRDVVFEYLKINGEDIPLEITL